MKVQLSTNYNQYRNFSNIKRNSYTPQNVSFKGSYNGYDVLREVLKEKEYCKNTDPEDISERIVRELNISTLGVVSTRTVIEILAAALKSHVDNTKELKEIARAKDKIEKRESQLAEKQKGLDAMERANTQRSEALDKREEQIANKEAEIAKTNEEINNALAQIENDKAENARVKAENDEVTANLDKLREPIREEERKKAQEEVKEQKEELEKKKEALEEQQQQINDKQSALDKRESDLDEREEKLKESEQALTTVLNTLATQQSEELKSEYNERNEELDKRENALVAAESLLKQQEKDELAVNLRILYNIPNPDKNNLDKNEQEGIAIDLIRENLDKINFTQNEKRIQEQLPYLIDTLANKDGIITNDSIEFLIRLFSALFPGEKYILANILKLLCIVQDDNGNIDLDKAAFAINKIKANNNIDTAIQHIYNAYEANKSYDISDDDKNNKCNILTNNFIYSLAVNQQSMTSGILNNLNTIPIEKLNLSTLISLYKALRIIDVYHKTIKKDMYNTITKIQTNILKAINERSQK